MIVITRNGKTTVYKGWQAWPLAGAAIMVAWLLFAMIAFVFVGVAITVGIAMLLLVPALLVVSLVSVVMGRKRHDA